MKKKNGLHIKIACEGAALVELDDLIPFQGELKSLSKENYQRLRQEIIDTGVGFPFRVWRDDGKFFLIGGHQTKLVLTQMRDEEGFSLGRVPVSFTEARDYEEAKRRVLQDITQYGKVERQGLYQFLNESKISFDELQKRFDVPGIDLKKFQIEYYELKNLSSGCGEDEVPDVKEEPKTVRGNIYQLGNHRLMCGDSTSIDDVGRLMNGEKADMVFTDPPYGMNAVSNSGVLKAKYKTDIHGDDNTNSARDSFNICVRLGIPKMVFWGSNYYSSHLPDSACWIVWDKNNGQSDQMDCELAWTNLKGVTRQFTQASEKKDRVHPTQKPVSLAEWCFSRYEADSVLDLFGGSGSTLIACEKTDRRCFMMEIDPHYCDVIIARWEKYTGKKACLSK